MITLEVGRVRPVSIEKEGLDIIKQIRLLVEKGIEILRDDGLMFYHEVEDLSQRIDQYLMRETRILAQSLQTGYLGHRIWATITRPRRPKLNVRWFDMSYAYHRTRIES